MVCVFFCVPLRSVRSSPSLHSGSLCRERRSKTAKTVRWTVFSESPSNYVAKVDGAANASFLRSLLLLRNVFGALPSAHANFTTYTRRKEECLPSNPDRNKVKAKILLKEEGHIYHKKLLNFESVHSFVL